MARHGRQRVRNPNRWRNPPPLRQALLVTFRVIDQFSERVRAAARAVFALGVTQEPE